MKTWKPDTCGCVIEEIYDGSTIIGPGRVLQKCHAHDNVLDHELYNVLWANPDGENRRKNEVLRILQGYEAAAALNLDELTPDGGRRLKQGIEYLWEFEGADHNRVLKVNIKGASLTVSQKTAFLNVCSTKFGNSKVKLM